MSRPTTAQKFKICELLKSLGQEHVEQLTRADLYRFVNQNVEFPITVHNIDGAIKILGWNALQRAPRLPTATDAQNAGSGGGKVVKEITRLRSDFAGLITDLRNDFDELNKRLDGLHSSYIESVTTVNQLVEDVQTLVKSLS